MALPHAELSEWSQCTSLYITYCAYDRMMLMIIVQRGRKYKDCWMAFPWKRLIAHATISTSVVWNEIYILIISCAEKGKQQKLCYAKWVWAPWFWVCLNAVCCKLERDPESLLKPLCLVYKPSGQGAKQKNLKTGYYYPKGGIYLMNLHSLPVIFGHLVI